MQSTPHTNETKFPGGVRESEKARQRAFAVVAQLSDKVKHIHDLISSANNTPLVWYEGATEEPVRDNHQFHAEAHAHVAPNIVAEEKAPNTQGQGEHLTGSTKIPEFEHNTRNESNGNESNRVVDSEKMNSDEDFSRVPSVLNEIDDEDGELIQDFFERSQGFGLDEGVMTIDAIRKKLQSLQEVGQSRDEASMIQAVCENVFGSEAETGGQGAVGMLDQDTVVNALASRNPNRRRLQRIVSVLDFKAIMKEIPRVRGQRLRWVASLGLNAHLAKFLKKGNILDGLHGLKTLGKRDADQHVMEVCEKFGKILPHILRTAIEKLRLSVQNAQVIQQHINDKFAETELYVGKFATLDDFYNGSESLIGTPNPKIFDGIEKEHTVRKNAHTLFTTSNFAIETCSRLEWEIVVCPVAGRKYPHTPKEKSKWETPNSWKGNSGRDVMDINMLMSKTDVKNKVDQAGLSREEVICLRLYTGPMFALYNCALRNAPESLVECLQGNKYETTIFVMTSGITKLSKVTGIPTSRKLYRGLADGMVLPDQFWRGFEEHQVHLSVTGSSNEEAKRLLTKFRSRTKDVQRKVMLSSREVVVKCLEKPDGMLSCPKDILQDGELPDDISLVSDRVVGKMLHIVVTFQAPILEFKQRSQELLKSVVAFCSGKSISDVRVEKCSVKPKDFKGGVEFGFLSLTTSKNTALCYNNGKYGLVFEIQAGRVDVGASIQFLSQYPDEDEYLMPPLSCLEVMGDPYIEDEHVVLPLRVNINLKSVTVEDLIRRRKDLQTAMSKNLGEDLQHTTTANWEILHSLLADRWKGYVEVLRGNSVHIHVIKDEKYIVHFDFPRWAIVGAPYLHISSGKIYYEIEVLEDKGTLAVGFAGTSFRIAEKIDIGDDALSWGIYSFGKARHNNESQDLRFGKWMQAGCVLGVAVDLDEGTMYAATGIISDENPKPEWQEIFGPSAGLRPGWKVGSALFPVLAGGWGAKLSYNFGHLCRPFKLRPPSEAYQSVERRHVMSSAHWQDLAALQLNAGKMLFTSMKKVVTKKPEAEAEDDMLCVLGVGPEQLVVKFDELLHRADVMDPAAFNDDHFYKDRLNEILDTKAGLAKKQETIIMLLTEGASIRQLAICRDAPPSDFRECGTLEAECPSYTWRLVLSGWFRFLSKVHIPLECPPCLIALLWREIFECKGSVKSVTFGDVVIEMTSMFPKFRLKKMNLHASKFERALVGFFIAVLDLLQDESGNDADDASALVQNTNLKAYQGRDFHNLSSLYLCGIEFSFDRILQIIRLVLIGCDQGFWSEVNNISLSYSPEKNLRDCVFRAEEKSDEHLSQVVEMLRKDAPFQDDSANTKHSKSGKSSKANKDMNRLGKILDAVDWAFVLWRAGKDNWRTLDISANEMDINAAKAMSAGLIHATSLTSLDLSWNLFRGAGATHISSSLSQLAMLKSLAMANCEIGPDGATALAKVLGSLTSLSNLRVENNELTSAGAMTLCQGLRLSSALTCLNLAENVIHEDAGKEISSLVKASPHLISLNLAKQDLARATWLVLAELSPNAHSLQVSYGVIEAVLTTAKESVHKCVLQIPVSKYLDLDGTKDLLKSLLTYGASPLTCLDLTSNHLYEDAAVALGDGLSSLASLKKLILTSNFIGDDGAIAICNGATKLNNLECLAIEKNGIRISGWIQIIPTFEKMRSLTSLNGWNGIQHLILGQSTDVMVHGEELGVAVCNLIPKCASVLESLDLSHTGFISQSDADLQPSLTQIGRCSLLRSLNIDNGQLGFTGAQAVADVVGRLATLTSLSLRGVHLGPEGGRQLSTGLRLVTSLKFLDLGENYLNSDGIMDVCHALQKVTGLKGLDLGANEIGVMGATSFASVMSFLVELERLDLSDNSLGSEGGEAIGRTLTHLTNLQHLDVSSNELNEHGIERMVQSLADLTTLTELQLKCNQLGSSLCEHIHMDRLSSLTTLNMSTNQMGPISCCRMLFQFKFLASLQCLELAENSLGQDPGYTTEMAGLFSNLVSLHTLRLESNHFDDASGAALMDGLALVTTLKQLFLKENSLGVKDACALKGRLDKLHSLEVLDLSNNLVDSTGVQVMVECLDSLTALTELHLVDNGIGPQGSQLLTGWRGFSRLVSVDLRGNDLGAGGLSATVFRRLHATRASAAAARSVRSRRASSAGGSARDKEVMRGYLQKLNTGMESEMDRDSSWRERLCFVSGGCMSYRSAKKKGEVEVVCELARIRNLSRHAATGGADDSLAAAGRYVFRLEVEGGRPVFFAAATEAERDEWMAALAPPRATPPDSPSAASLASLAGRPLGGSPLLLLAQPDRGGGAT